MGSAWSGLFRVNQRGSDP